VTENEVTVSGRESLLTLWRRQSITIKLALSQATLVILIVLIALTGYLALRAVSRQTEAAKTSMEIQRLALEMNATLQHARRLSRDFFMRWPTIGFEQARDIYARGNDERIAEVMAHSVSLSELISASDVSEALRDNDVNLRFYLSAADRYSTTFTETVELVTRLAASDTGALTRLVQTSTSLRETLEMANDPALLLAYREMQVLEKEYLVTRQRPFMQSAFNAIVPLEKATESSRLSATQRVEAAEALVSYRAIAEEILRLDVDIRNRFDEFDQQADAVDPISEELIALADEEVLSARARITRTARVATLLLALAVVAAVALAGFIAKVLHASITANIIKLTGTASELESGNLKARAQITSMDELGQLADTFNNMAAQLDTLILNLEEKVAERTAELTEANRIISKHRDRMQEELNIGREIQMSMIPLTFPAFPDREDFTVYATLQPAREVGGDFYDFFFIGKDRFCFCIGDVAGKGVPAALFMAVTKTLIKSRAVDERSTTNILNHVNRELSRNNKESMFVTVFLGILDISTGELVYTNAGHNPPYLMRADGELVRLDERHGPVVGALEDLEYREDTETLHPGDLVFLYTDGLTEAMNSSLNLYSESRLAGWLEDNGRGAVEDIVDGMVEDVKRFEAGADQADDLTILAVVLHGDAGAGQYEALKLELSNQLSEVERLNVAFSEFAEKSNVPKRIVNQFKLVFDELLTNIVSHAYSDDGEHTILTDIRLFGDKIVATIADDGKFFNPLKYGTPPVEASIDEREVGGLGIHLVRNVMDEVRYRRAGETNVVSVVKYLDASVQAAAVSLPDTSHDEKS